MARKAKKGSSRYYFTMTTEKAIIRYNNAEDNHVLRNKIYNEHIRKAFEKLVENIIHTFKFYYFDVSSEEVKHEVVSFLVMNMHKFKEGKGRAFSYFSIVAKNYLILNNNKNYTSEISHCVSIKPRDINAKSIANDLFSSYKSMIHQMNIGDIDIINKPLKPYNLLITSEWIALITRKTDRSNGFSINALGFAGYFLGTKRSDVDTLIKFGPERILMDVI